MSVEATCICGDAACQLPMCACGEWHASTEGRCRDCDIQHCLDRMQCSVCKRMRYRQDHAQLAAVGEALWGEVCTCDPATTLSVAQAAGSGSPA